MKAKIHIPLAVLALSSIALSQDGLPVADLERDTPVDFAKEIVPFLKKNCFACHNERKSKADLNLESPQAMMTGGDSGPAIIAGKPMESLVFTYAAHLEDDPMPPAKNKSNANNLAPDQLALLKLWIEQGAKGTSASVLAGPTEWQPLDDMHAIYSVAISDDGRFAACGRGNRLYLYDLRSGTLEAVLHDPKVAPGTAHHDFVHSLAFSRNGLLASGGYRTVKLWERTTTPATRLAHTLPENATALATSPNGEWLAAGDGKGNVILQNLATPEKSPAAKLHSATVRAMVFSPDGKFLFSVSDDKTVVRAAFPDPKDSPTATLPSEALSLALLENGQKVAVGCADGIIRIIPISFFDLPQAERGTAPPPAEFKGHTAKVVALRALNEGGTQLLSASEDGSARTWDLAGKQVRQLAHGSPIVALAVHRGTNRIATAGGDGVVRIWNAPDGKKLSELQGDLDFDIRRTRTTQERDLRKRIAELRKKQLGEREKKWNELKEKSKTDAAKVAEALKDLAAKETVSLAKRAAAKVLHDEIAALEAAKDPGLGKAKERAKKPDEEAAKANNELVTAERTLRNAERTRDLTILDGTKAGQRFLATQAASAQADAVLATAEEAVKAREAEAATAGSGVLKSLAYSPDGQTLAVGAEKIGLRLWNAVTAQPLDILQKQGAATALIHGADGRLIAALPDKTLAVWKDSVRWSMTRQLGDASKPEPFPDRVLALAFHPRGHVLATGCGVPSRSGQLRFWRVQDGSAETAIVKAHLDTITGLAFSPDGHRIASASTDRFVKIHRVDSGELLDQLEGHTDHVLDVAWSADGETLASAGADHVAKLWSVDTRKQKKTETGFKKELSAIAFLGTSDNIVMGGGDKVVKAAGQNLAGIDTFIYGIAVSADGATIVTGGENGVLRIFRSSDRKQLHSFPPPGRTPTATAAN
ncbi:MAG: c-type cytochrome domain-containing protein [Roseibacillus sp.]